MAIGTRLLVIILSITIALTFGVPNLSIPDNSSVIGFFGYNYTYDNVTNTSYVDTSNANQTMNGIQIQTNETGITSGNANFFDRFTTFSGWLSRFTTNFFLAPVVALRSADAPEELILLVGIIWGVLWASAIASFIWRKDF